MNGILQKFEHDAKLYPDRPLYNFLDCSTDPIKENPVTIGEAWDHALDVAATLRAKGAKKGDRAIILSLQDAGTVYAVWGCMIAGVVFTVIPPPLDDGKFDRFVSVLKTCKPKFLISNEGMEKEANSNVAGKLLKRAFFNVLTLKRIYTDKLQHHTGAEKPVVHEKEDLLYLQFTSGSTSSPKGVMVSHGNLMACIDQCLEIFDFQHTKNNLASWVPFYHNIGLIVAIFLPVIADTGVSYFIPTLQFLANPTVWLRVLSDYKVNITAAPNSAYDVIPRLVNPEQAKKYDLAHMTHLINGSEFVNASTVEKFCKLFHISPNAFAPGYGLSECVCIGTLASQDYRCVHLDQKAYRSGIFQPAPKGAKAIVSVGCPAGDMELVAVDAQGNPCAPGVIGEIYIRGSSVCGGYWQNPEETKRFQASIPGYGSGFYRTGDMGVIHEGHLYLTGRIKEMIIVNGKNIFPSDILLLLHQKGIPLPSGSIAVFAADAQEGEMPVLCAEAPADTDFRRLAIQINRLVSMHFGFSFPDIVFIPAGTIPRTDNGKLKTLAAKDLYDAGKLPKLYSMMEQHDDAEQPVPEEQEEITFPADATLEQIQDAIYRMFQRMLPCGEFSLDDSFLELGGDSLNMMELACSLEGKLGISLDVRKIASEPTVAGISQYLFDCLNGLEKENEIDLNQECVLPEDIAPENPYDLVPGEIKNVLVTGTTGFLGAYLTQSLIEQQGHRDIKIYCHARANSPEKAMERIVENMKRFACWNESYRAFIVPVPGDLNMPHLGMDDNTWQELTGSIDAVYHNGAILNFVFPYSGMKNTNVLGTAECLRFACTGKAKYFHYISSYSVYDNPSHFGKRVMEDDPLASCDGYFLGYSETKWVAEKLVGIVAQRGLRTSVYRPGDITGTLKDGIWKLEDLISRSIVGCIQLGAVPDIRVNLHLTPVDYVADSIVHISFRDNCWGKAFNIINHNIMPMEQMTALMNMGGIPIEILPYDRWCQKLVACSNEENVLRILSCLFTDQRLPGENLIDRYGINQAQFDTTNTDTFLEGSGITCPPADAALMLSYLRYFAKCGYIPNLFG